MSQPVNVNVNVSAQPIFIKSQDGCLIQLLWFVFVGWWAGALAVVVAYLLLALIITIPLGIAILNNVPYIMARRQPTRFITVGGDLAPKQHNFFLRAIWFLVLGWGLTLIWLVVAYTLCLTIILMPIGFWMFDKAPALLTLRKSSMT